MSYDLSIATAHACRTAKPARALAPLRANGLDQGLDAGVEHNFSFSTCSRQGPSDSAGAVSDAI